MACARKMLGLVILLLTDRGSDIIVTLFHAPMCRPFGAASSVAPYPGLTTKPILFRAFGAGNRISVTIISYHQKPFMPDNYDEVDGRETT